MSTLVPTTPLTPSTQHLLHFQPRQYCCAVCGDADAAADQHAYHEVEAVATVHRSHDSKHLLPPHHICYARCSKCTHTSWFKVSDGVAVQGDGISSKKRKLDLDESNDVIDLTADLAPSTGSAPTLSHLTLTVTHPEFALSPNYVNILHMHAPNVCRYLREAQRCAGFQEDGGEMLTPLAYTLMVRATLEAVCKHKLHDDVDDEVAITSSSHARHGNKRPKHDTLNHMLPKLKSHVPLKDLQVKFEDIIAPLQTIQKLGNQAAHDCQAPSIETCGKLWRCLKVLLHLVYVYPAQKAALIAERQRQQPSQSQQQQQPANKKQRIQPPAYAGAASAAQRMINSNTVGAESDSSDD